ncbi:hypothetical protein RB614_38575 [Phytohabitans sp. ZYX-F-186]|uniref:Uncharacterized protein n=1 Tax=Phytohabitans maris TaxID=3071409 RepID=A0ABU0ZUF2_9ACTN|nr:hypothetical protein [Phytohabitans sp. ZYX-F-186]MDQ7910416.1 hypothetical protein [Phytohabitans sp. ZYX-F-186]
MTVDLDRSVLVVDDPAPADPAASWGYWTARTGLLDVAAARSYDRVRVHAGGAGGVVPLGRYRYQVVRRPDPERLVRSIAGGCPGYAFRRGRVESVRTRGDHAEVPAVLCGLNRPWRSRSRVGPARPS